MTQIPIQCPDCQAEVKFIPAGISRKTGKPYSEFYSCAKRCGWTWREGKETRPVATTESPRDIILMEELKAINVRLEKIWALLVKKLGKEDEN